MSWNLRAKVQAIENKLMVLKIKARTRSDGQSVIVANRTGLPAGLVRSLIGSEA